MTWEREGTGQMCCYFAFCFEKVEKWGDGWMVRKDERRSRRMWESNPQALALVGWFEWVGVPGSNL